MSKYSAVRDAVNNIDLFLRSLIFFIYSVSSIALYSLLCALSFPFPLRFRHALIRAYLATFFSVLKIVCRIDYHIEGIHHLAEKKNGIVMSKHQSTWETFFLPLYFHEPAIILKRELLWVPFFGWGLAAADPIAINRKARSSAMQQIITKGKSCLEAGRWILIFPEGTRIPPGKTGHYRLGGARLAASTGYPILPIAHNAGYFWPKRGFIKRPGTVQVVIGPWIESTGRNPEEILDLVKTWIEETVVKIEKNSKIGSRH